MEEEEVSFSLIYKLKVVFRNTSIANLHVEIQDMVHEFDDILVDDLIDNLKPKRKFTHHIDLILGASLPNKVAYRMAPKEKEEIRKQVKKLLDK